MTTAKIEADARQPPPPFARWVSDEARRTFDSHVRAAARPFESLLHARAFYDAENAERLVQMRQLFPAEVASATLGGVPVEIVTPAGQAPVLTPDAPVLICLHGGGFAWGAGPGALLEAIPIAAVSGMTVVAIDYRMAPEHLYPAATEDVVAVYRALLETRPGSKIGLFGCSAGGILTAQVVARLQGLGEPRPGAAAMMHATGMELDGDLLRLAPMMTGDPPSAGVSELKGMPYFGPADPADPEVLPGDHPDVLARFPPSLLITATRDFAASSMSVMHRRLLAAGAEADFVLFDGLWHAFHMTADLPESRELYGLVSGFFRQRLT
ncbi:MAG: hypothetical protein JWR84_3120 [Caulobacter sp.]|nr:hypothetical protein [Caulobacter sp.]